jgi:peptidoglycan/LPS O-acetylase OafA/YrhL
VSVSRETAIGIGVTALAVVAMAFDHLDLLGDDFPADPAAFFISSALCVALAGVAFGIVIPRVKRSVPIRPSVQRGKASYGACSPWFPALRLSGSE